MTNNSNPIAVKTGPTLPKRRLSKGWRKHVRRMKQAARKASLTQS